VSNREGTRSFCRTFSSDLKASDCNRTTPKTFDKEQEQVRKRGRRYRGCDGTCVGVTGRTCAGDSRDKKGLL